MNLKFGITARFHQRVPTFFGERVGHIQYLESHFASWLGQKGAMPLMIPSVSRHSGIHESDLDPAAYAQNLDALILQGGADVHPRFYGKEPELSEYTFDEERDLYELKLIEAFLKEGKPILGICRGFQLLNVFFGGTLYQDLERVQIAGHLNKEKDHGHEHLIRIQEGGDLSLYYPGVQQAKVSSIHHQGILELGPDLFIEARSEPDGLIEAFSMPGEAFVMGVQWHPEFHDSKTDKRLNGKELFEAIFVAAKNRKFLGTASPSKKKKVQFGRSAALTLGGEIELQLVDDQTFDLKPICPELIAEIQDQTERTKSEIFQSMIEFESGVCESALQVEVDWQTELTRASIIAKKLGAEIAATGAHPFAKISERILTNKPRYQKLMEKNQWIARRIAIFGLHCHVGMQSKDDAIRFYRFYMALSPLLLGLSSSSPFWESEVTGLASVRSTFFESIPSGGHPPVLDNWQQFEGLFQKMIKARAIGSHKDLWWDLRPSLDYGTLEIRICDVMPTLKENAALIAFIHLLGVAFLDGVLVDITWPTLSEWSYRENKWRAARYGLGFDFIIKEDATTAPAADYLEMLIGLINPLAEAWGYQEYVQILRDLIQKGTSSDRQLKVYKSTDSLLDVVKHNVKELQVGQAIYF